MRSLLEKIDANILFWGYIAVVLIAVLLVSKVLRRNKSSESEDRFIAMLDWFETRGFGTFFHLLVLGGVLLMALIGWRIPSEIERLYGNGASFGLIFPKVEIGVLGRAAQVIGAFGLGYIALRSMRFIVPIFTIVVLAVLIMMSVGYVFGFEVPKIV